MNIHIIACQVFYREISYLAALSPHATSIIWLPQGLHDTPDLLRKRVQQEIEEVERAIEERTYKHDPDIILIGYGLCSNGTVGLSSRSLPLVIPRTDDCIGVFLGSQKRYLTEFSEHPGTYWLNNGWLETAFLPTKQNYDKMWKTYAEEYGEDNADFLLEQEQAWVLKYDTLGYITSEIYQNDGFEQYAEEIGTHNNWRFLKLDGDAGFLRRLLDGIFDEKEVLVCPPGHCTAASFDEQKLTFTVDKTL